jgi:predicted aspartyl protease
LARSAQTAVDTGASNCLFEREHGEMLDIDVETGESKTFWTANGRVETFGHVVEIEFAGLRVESMVYFFADEQIRRSLLGRTGWLDRVRLGLVDHDLSLYLAPYDFEQE